MRDFYDTVAAEVKLLWQKTRAMPQEAQGRLVLFLVMLLFVIGSYAFTLSIIYRSWAQPEYEFGPLIPILALVVLWVWRKPIVISSYAEQIGGVALILFCTAARYVSLHYYAMQQPMYYTLIGSLVGLLMILGGLSMLKWTWPSLILLTLAIPFSAKMEEYSFHKLQEFSTKCSIYALETLGVDVIAEGNKITLRREKAYTVPNVAISTSKSIALSVAAKTPLVDPDADKEDVQLNVAEQCAGFKGMLTTTALTLTVVFLIEAELWVKIVLVICSPFIALFANIVRIVLQTLCYQLSANAANIFHDYVAGFVVYPLIFGLLYLVFVILRNLVLDDKQELSLPQSPANTRRMKLPQPLPVPQAAKR